MESNSRRSFIKKTALVSAGISLLPNLSYGINLNNSKKKEILKIAFIGVGLRGMNHLNNALNRKDVEITAICDIDPKRITIALDRIKKEGLIGIENQPQMYALSASNMILRGDGKANLHQGSCFDEAITKEVKKQKCNVGMINPPYSQSDEDLH